jgi:hypothetical protein
VVGWLQAEEARVARKMGALRAAALLLLAAHLLPPTVAPDEHGNPITEIEQPKPTQASAARRAAAGKTQRRAPAPTRAPPTSETYETDDGTVRSLMGLVSESGLKPHQQWPALRSLQSGSLQSREAVQSSTMDDLKQCGLKIGHARKILEISKQPTKHTTIQRTPSEPPAQPDTSVSWSRPLQCIDVNSPKTTHHLASKDFRKITTYTDRAHRSPVCFAPSKARCFRASIDGFATAAETASVVEAFRCDCSSGEDPKCNVHDCPTTRREHAEHPVMRAWEKRIRGILDAHFGVPINSLHLHNVSAAAS